MEYLSLLKNKSLWYNFYLSVLTGIVFKFYNMGAFGFFLYIMLAFFFFSAAYIFFLFLRRIFLFVFSKFDIQRDLLTDFREEYDGKKRKKEKV